MPRKHIVYFKDSLTISKCIKPSSVDLVVTSPPYPMISMWDELFFSKNNNIKKFIENDPMKSFKLMHRVLNTIWEELFLVVKPGGIVCINIGDAVRTINKNFYLFPNHAEIINNFNTIGFQSLPGIIWRKQTNAPNKFMGSGMLPPGGYVTLEHEHILIFRKEERRKLDKSEEKQNRRESSYFWEERNKWFSDVWDDLKGVKQSMKGVGRSRNAAFPLELSYRLIQMFSVKSDIVIDPFLGTGTTTVAAMMSNRQSIGFELDTSLKELIEQNINNSIKLSEQKQEQRLTSHKEFVSEHSKDKYNGKNTNYNFKVKTSQEMSLKIEVMRKIIKNFDNKNKIEFEVVYA